MAPSNSTKKLAKVARSSRKGRSFRERSDRTFPAVIVAILLVGGLLVFYGRAQRAEAQDTPPRLGRDHWHAAYGIYLCDAFSPPLRDLRGDRTGIHTHDDGVIHIHPHSSRATGDRARLDLFFEEVGLRVNGGTLRMPDGTEYVSGETTCPDGEVGQLVLARWESADDPEGAPELVRDGIRDVRFTSDRMAFTLAFVPESRFGDIPRPLSIPNLDNLTDMPGAGVIPPPASDNWGQTDPTGSGEDGTGSEPAEEPGGATTTEVAPTTTAG